MGNEWITFDFPPRDLCIFIRYMSKTFGGLIANSHFLIAVNRLWAIARPLSYRNYHPTGSVSRPVIVCGLMWLYVHACSVPMIVTDAINPRPASERYHCLLSAAGPRGWMVANQIIVYDLPMVFAFLVYPYICYRNFINSKFKRVKITATLKDQKPVQKVDVYGRDVVTAGGAAVAVPAVKAKVEQGHDEKIDSSAC